MPAFTEHSIAPGWNNVGGLVQIGLIVPEGNIAFPEPSANHGYYPGKVIVRMDNGGALAGIDRLTWKLSTTFEQYLHLNTDYCAGVYRGQVTVRTRWQNRPYANYNAWMAIQYENLTFNLTGYTDIDLVFNDLRVIA